MDAPSGPAPLFFLVGPLRTGSSLLSRCIDDHPDAICLCESEINRSLFRPYAIKHHFARMEAHGLSVEQSLNLLNSRRQDDVGDWRGWYDGVFPVLRSLYGKPDARALGDKSPDFFMAPPLVEAIAGDTLVYSVRDPRSILRSIWKQEDSDLDQKQERWDFLKLNIRCWAPHWDRPNLLAVRFEDLVRDPVPTMAQVYAHLKLAPSNRFLEPFERARPRRFLWGSAIDYSTGVARPFDPARAAISDEDLAPDQLARICDDAEICAFMERFGYASAEQGG